MIADAILGRGEKRRRKCKGEKTYTIHSPKAKRQNITTGKRIPDVQPGEFQVVKFAAEIFQAGPDDRNQPQRPGFFPSAGCRRRQSPRTVQPRTPPPTTGQSPPGRKCARRKTVAAHSKEIPSPGQNKTRGGRSAGPPAAPGRRRNRKSTGPRRETGWKHRPDENTPRQTPAKEMISPGRTDVPMVSGCSSRPAN